MKKELSVGQRKVASEILGNIAVAWFSAGVISPLLIRPETIVKATLLLVSALVAIIIYFLLMRGGK